MPDRPTGTVTFLFTDIEGSTRLWEHQHDLMQAAFQRHEAILREAIAAHGGYAYKMIGDAFQAAFQTAPDALQAALVAQRALVAEPWGPIGEVRVRMAVHTGTVEERGDDYVGPLLNRVARLLSTGHGGQILLTATTRELVRDQLPPGAQLRDLGEHRLKDLVRPEHVFQVVAPDLHADFPPLKSLDTRPNNLPVQATPLIGREREVVAVRDLLLRPGVRLVTLTGPGGTGKTRLGLQVAADVLDHFEHGVYFVNLDPIGDPALVASAIAQPLAVREQGGKPLLESLKDYLRDKQLLLLLDNFEQVTAAAPLVAALLAAAPRLAVLVTSREVLHLYGEHDVAVPPLTLPDPRHPLPLERLTQYEAVRLFIERARAARSDFTITHENAPAVAEICYRLDGLPLAIELAAARIRLLPPQAMLQRLTSRLRLLTGGARDLPPRQQTLRGAITWSYDLLAADEQALFRRLAVFVGGFALDAVEAVYNVSGDLDVDVLDAVDSLVGKSLLRETAPAEDELRLGMLETIREYALERLNEGGEADETRLWHAAYFLQLAEQAEPHLAGPQQIAWLNRLDLEHDNLRAALQWAIDRGDAATALRLAGSLSRFWHSRGYAGEGRQWLAQALALPYAMDHVRERTKALAGAALLVTLLVVIDRELAAARALAEQFISLAREVGDERGLAQALTMLGWIEARQGDPQAAQPYLHEGLALARRINDPWLLAYILRNQGLSALFRGEHATAKGFLEEAAALFRQTGDRLSLAQALMGWSVLAMGEGDLARGEALLEESIPVIREASARWYLGLYLNRLGDFARLRENYERAEGLYTEAVAIWRDLGMQADTAAALHNLGYAVLSQGDVGRARSLFAESLALHQAQDNRAGIAEGLAGLAAVAATEQQAEHAARLLGAVEALREHLGGVLWPAERHEWERYVLATRVQLEDATFEAAWAEGHAMSLEHAIAYALEETPAG